MSEAQATSPSLLDVQITMPKSARGVAHVLFPRKHTEILEHNFNVKRSAKTDLPDKGLLGWSVPTKANPDAVIKLAQFETMLRNTKGDVGKIPVRYLPANLQANSPLSKRNKKAAAAHRAACILGADADDAKNGDSLHAPGENAATESEPPSPPLLDVAQPSVPLLEPTVVTEHVAAALSLPKNDDSVNSEHGSGGGNTGGGNTKKRAKKGERKPFAADTKRQKQESAKREKRGGGGGGGGEDGEENHAAVAGNQSRCRKHSVSPGGRRRDRTSQSPTKKKRSRAGNKTRSPISKPVSPRFEPVKTSERPSSSAPRERFPGDFEMAMMDELTDSGAIGSPTRGLRSSPPPCGASGILDNVDHNSTHKQKMIPSAAKKRRNEEQKENKAQKESENEREGEKCGREASAAVRPETSEEEEEDCSDNGNCNSSFDAHAVEDEVYGSLHKSVSDNSETDSGNEDKSTSAVDSTQTGAIDNTDLIGSDVLRVGHHPRSSPRPVDPVQNRSVSPPNQKDIAALELKYPICDGKQMLMERAVVSIRNPPRTPEEEYDPKGGITVGHEVPENESATQPEDMRSCVSAPAGPRTRRNKAPSRRRLAVQNPKRTRLEDGVAGSPGGGNDSTEPAGKTPASGQAGTSVFATCLKDRECTDTPPQPQPQPQQNGEQYSAGENKVLTKEKISSKEDAHFAEHHIAPSSCLDDAGSDHYEKTDRTESDENGGVDVHDDMAITTPDRDMDGDRDRKKRTFLEKDRMPAQDSGKAEKKPDVLNVENKDKTDSQVRVIKKSDVPIVPESEWDETCGTPFQYKPNSDNGTYHEQTLDSNDVEFAAIRKTQPQPQSPLPRREHDTDSRKGPSSISAPGGPLYRVDREVHSGTEGRALHKSPAPSIENPDRSSESQHSLSESSDHRPKENGRHGFQDLFPSDPLLPQAVEAHCENFQSQNPSDSVALKEERHSSTSRRHSPARPVCSGNAHPHSPTWQDTRYDADRDHRHEYRKSLPRSVHNEPVLLGELPLPQHKLTSPPKSHTVGRRVIEEDNVSRPLSPKYLPSLSHRNRQSGSNDSPKSDRVDFRVPPPPPPPPKLTSPPPRAEDFREGHQKEAGVGEDFGDISHVSWVDNVIEYFNNFETDEEFDYITSSDSD